MTPELTVWTQVRRAPFALKAAGHPFVLTTDSTICSSQSSETVTSVPSRDSFSVCPFLILVKQSYFRVPKFWLPDALFFLSVQCSSSCKKLAALTALTWTLRSPFISFPLTLNNVFRLLFFTPKVSHKPFPSLRIWFCRWHSIFEVHLFPWFQTWGGWCWSQVLEDVQSFCAVMTEGCLFSLLWTCSSLTIV